MKVLAKLNGALRRFESFWFAVVPAPPPGLGNNQARDDEVLTTLWFSEPDAHVHITWSPALILVVVGEKKLLPTETLAVAPRPESGPKKQGKNAVKRARKSFLNENIIAIHLFCCRKRADFTFIYGERDEAEIGSRDC